MTMKGTEVNWRTLWRLIESEDGGTTTYSFISLDNGPERWAFPIEEDAPVAQVAKLYYDTVDKCEAMTRAAFEDYAHRMERKREELVARDKDKTEAFYAAIQHVQDNLRAMDNQGLEEDTAFLFDQQEKP